MPTGSSFDAEHPVAIDVSIRSSVKSWVGEVGPTITEATPSPSRTNLAIYQARYPAKHIEREIERNLG